MKDTNTQDGMIDPQELGRQLRCPSGENGLKVATMMNETNDGMMRSTVDHLDLKDNHTILELGPGNGSHIRNIMERARNIHYYGLELSETMHKEASRINRDLIDQEVVSIQHYDGVKIPFADNNFDRIMTVNTLYFWSDPETFMNEIRRILKPGGYCVITYAQKESMKKLPFVQEVFRLYNDNDVRELVKKANLDLLHIEPKTEQIKIRPGELAERTYSIAKAGKHS